MYKHALIHFYRISYTEETPKKKDTSYHPTLSEEEEAYEEDYEFDEDSDSDTDTEYLQTLDMSLR